MALSGLLSLASKVADLFENPNNAEKRSLIGFTFSNLELDGATLRYSPIDMFVDLNQRKKWLPFLNTYRTMCLAPRPGFRRILEEVREMRVAA